MKQACFSMLKFIFCLLFFFSSKETFAQYTLNGDAVALGGDCFSLTDDLSWQSGTVFSNTKIDLNEPFSLSGQYNFGDTNSGADGIIFMFTQDNNALGRNGGYLGFQGVSPSFAWEVDDFQNFDFDDPSQDHMAILKNGSVLHNSSGHLVGPVILPSDIEDGEDHLFQISWQPETNTFTACLDGILITYIGDIIEEVFGGDSKVYYGFGSATGTQFNPHRVCLTTQRIEEMDDLSICPNESIQLQADPNADSYEWVLDPTLNRRDIFNPIANPDKTTIYVVKMTFGCIEKMDTVLVNVLPVTDTILPNIFTCLSADTGMFMNIYANRFGCDSLVYQTVEFEGADTIPIASTTCDPLLAGIFYQSFPITNACDSVVEEIVTLIPAAASTITSMTCDVDKVGVFTHTLVNHLGCDSLVFETVTLKKIDTTYLPAASCNPLDTGSTILEFITLEGCDSTIVITTELLPSNQCALDFSIIGDSIFCDETFGSLSIEITNGRFPFEYQWELIGALSSGSGTTNNPLIEIGDLKGGIYSITVTDFDGLSAIVLGRVLEIVPPTLTLSAGQLLTCFGDDNGSVISSLSGDYPPYWFSWSTGETTPNLGNLIAGNYEVTVTDNYGCEVVRTLTLMQPEALTFALEIEEVSCRLLNDGAVLIAGEGGTPPYRFSINGTDFFNENSFLNLSEGNYELTIQDENDCTEFIDFELENPEELTVDLTGDLAIELGENTTLEAMINTSFNDLISVIWLDTDSLNCPDCLMRNVMPFVTTTYSVLVEDDRGCIARDEVTISVNSKKSVYVPSAFTPNNDGINDNFFIFAKPGTVATIHTFQIYDRWGNFLFRNDAFLPNDFREGWDGTFRFKPLDSAVFAWFAEIEFLDGEMMLLKGDVTLLR